MFFQALKASAKSNNALQNEKRNVERLEKVILNLGKLLEAICNHLQRTLTYRVLRVASLAFLAYSNLHPQNCLDIYEAPGPLFFVVSVVLVLIGIGKKTW